MLWWNYQKYYLAHKRLFFVFFYYFIILFHFLYLLKKNSCLVDFAQSRLLQSTQYSTHRACNRRHTNWERVALPVANMIDKDMHGLKYLKIFCSNIIMMLYDDGVLHKRETGKCSKEHFSSNS